MVRTPIHDELLQLRRAEPFVAFDILMKNGDRVEVERPWYVFDENRIFFLRVKGRQSHLTVRFSDVASIQRSGSAEAA